MGKLQKNVKLRLCVYRVEQWCGALDPRHVLATTLADLVMREKSVRFFYRNINVLNMSSHQKQIVLS